MASELKKSNKRSKIVAKKTFFLANLGFINRSSQDFYGIGDTIRIGQEMFCLPYARFLKLKVACLFGYARIMEYTFNVYLLVKKKEEKIIEQI